MIFLGEIFWDYSAGKWTFLNAFLGGVEHLLYASNVENVFKKKISGESYPLY